MRAGPGELLDATKLLQLKLRLQEKLDILKWMDSEILELGKIVLMRLNFPIR